MVFHICFQRVRQETGLLRPRKTVELKAFYASAPCCHLSSGHDLVVVHRKLLSLFTHNHSSPRGKNDSDRRPSPSLQVATLWLTRSLPFQQLSCKSLTLPYRSRNVGFWGIETELSKGLVARRAAQPCLVVNSCNGQSRKDAR